VTNLADKQLLPKVFVGGIGLILLGIGIAGLASVRPAFSMTSMRMEPMMGSNMMGMMRMMDMMRDFATPMEAFSTNTLTMLNAYLVAMMGIYIGLITIGGYLIYRAVAPLMKVSLPSKVHDSNGVIAG